MNVLINLSNHPSSKWGEEQKKAAARLGKVIDLPFPAIDPAASKEEIQTLALSYVEKCEELFVEAGCIAAESRPFSTDTLTVMVQGEFTFVYNFVVEAKDRHIVCLAATTRRNTVELPDGSKQVRFEFVQFREY